MRHALGFAVLALLLAPLATSAWISFSPDSILTPPTAEWSLRWHAAFYRDGRWTAALGRSLGVAAAASILSLLAGTPLSWATARREFAGRRLLAGAALLPALVPPAALGLGLLPLLGGTLVGLALAHALLGLPLAYLVMRWHFDAEGEERELAARGLGATPWQTAWRITLPLARPALAVAGLGVFVVSLNESMVSLFLATPSTETLPAVAWPRLRDSASPLVAAASCASATASLAAVLLGYGLLSARKA